jgi:hypothetical protein
LLQSIIELPELLKCSCLLLDDTLPIGKCLGRCSRAGEHRERLSSEGPRVALAKFQLGGGKSQQVGDCRQNIAGCVKRVDGGPLFAVGLQNGRQLAEGFGTATVTGNQFLPDAQRFLAASHAVQAAAELFTSVGIAGIAAERLLQQRQGV